MNDFSTLSILFASLILILMTVSVIVFIVYYQRKQLQLQIKQQTKLQELETAAQKKLLKNSIEVQESERRRISKDLHDEIGGLLSATKLSIQSFSKSLKDQKDVYDRLLQTKSLVEESLLQVRNLSRDLTPRTLENFGLVAALEEFVSKMGKTSNTQFRLYTQHLETKERIDKNIELTIYRVIQELTNNALKHAKAEKIEIDLHKKADSIDVVFLDNGIGFDYEKNRKNIDSGLGIDNVVSRVGVVNGLCSYTSKPGEGTKVMFTIPILNNTNHEQN